MNEAGKQQQTSKGLVVKTTDMIGRKLTNEEQDREMRDKKGMAIQLWNELDKSARPRLQVPASSESSSVFSSADKEPEQ